ncbi:ComEC/Rec2 family competence protein [Salinibacillus xinjiangensis]|uniref:MBL fold metallo-hydrolase n=1 Tax=Salinibacillus xinjiangensis TaxID=1229268 RepID=A0A6G1XBI8_9BACI|nr:hypothetical protein [Salinibacillus xinjiangensis]MRG88275.1 hypothetical protein [Salinibacillus xinjiangensis]
MGKFKTLGIALIFILVWGMDNPQTMAVEDRLSEDEVSFTFFSLTDGESLLITTGNDKNILINTGSDESEEELMNQIKEITDKVDYLILTDKTEQACGNADQVIDQFHVTNVISPTSEPCVNIQSDSVESVVWEKEKAYELSPGLQLRTLKVSEDSDIMSLYITYGKNSLVFMSEGSEEIEEVIKKYPNQTEMIKIPEYASKDFPSEELLTQLDPHIAIIYNLKEPNIHAGLLERLGESWIDVYHLKRVGTIQIICTPEDYELQS